MTDLDATVAPPRAAPSTASRVAGALMALVGVANAAVGAWALVAGESDVGTGLAVGLLAAGTATAVAAVPVARGHRIVTFVALIVFELLLVPRLVGVGDATGPQLVSLVMLVVLVVALAVAAYGLHRRHRATAAGS